MDYGEFLNGSLNSFLPQPSPRFLDKTQQLGQNPEIRFCSKFEKSVSPTIVSKDKKSYSVLTRLSTET